MFNTTEETARQIQPALALVSNALRKLAIAASPNFGHDCYLHMELGQRLLADLGFQTDSVLGFSAWRLGESRGDVLAHVPFSDSPSKELGANGIPYHAWLSWQRHIIDLTTYQLPLKVRELDADDGGRTNLSWFPDYLCLPERDVSTFQHVMKGVRPGMCYYEARPELRALVASNAELDLDALSVARTLIENPNIGVFGPHSARRAAMFRSLSR